jgi:hypothetical protein
VAGDELAVLGLATSISDSALIVHRVVVRVSNGDVELNVMDAWKAIRKDEARSLGDLADALSNSLDRKRERAPDALAIKRVESPIRGRPSGSYDQRTRAEGAAMIAAASQGARYFGYRAVEIRPRGKALREAAAALPQYPADDDRRDAIAAACAALSDLRA